MDFKKKLAQTKQAITTTANKTKVAIGNAQLKEKTKLALVNIKEKTKDVKNSVVATSKEVTTNIKTKYQSFSDDHTQLKDDLNGAGESPRELVVTADTRVFGETLELGCMHSPVNYHPFLPDIVYKCLIYLFEKGTNEEGIFRLSGSITTIKQMKDEFDAGLDTDLSICYDPHAISGLLKLYLRELPDALIPGTLYITSGDQAVEHMRESVQRLSPVVKCFLAHLMRLLHEVSQNCSMTKMSVNNLAIVFCPTLHCSSEVLMFLIHNANEVFIDEDPLVQAAVIEGTPGEDLIDIDFGNGSHSDATPRSDGFDHQESNGEWIPEQIEGEEYNYEYNEEYDKTGGEELKDGADVVVNGSAEQPNMLML